MYKLVNIFFLILHFLKMEEKSNNIKKCEICQSQATNICFECFSYFCDQCSKFIHDKQINTSHKKEKIDYFVPIEIKCSEHPKNAINLFCIDEKGNLFFI